MLHKVCHKFQLHMKATSDHSLIQWEVINVCQTLKLILSGNCAQEGHYKSYKIHSEEHAYTNEHANMAD